MKGRRKEYRNEVLSLLYIIHLGCIERERERERCTLSQTDAAVTHCISEAALLVIYNKKY